MGISPELRVFLGAESWEHAWCKCWSGPSSCYRSWRSCELGLRGRGALQAVEFCKERSQGEDGAQQRAEELQRESLFGCVSPLIQIEAPLRSPPGEG